MLARRVEVWRRWKDGQSLTCDWPCPRQRPCGRSSSVEASWRDRSGFRVAVHAVCLRWLNAKTSPAESPAAARCGSSRKVCSRAPSTVSREVARHGGRAQYRASEADQQAWQSALRPKPCLLATHARYNEIVAGKLMQDWSPKQISGWLKTEYPEGRRACACRTKRFIAACSFKRAER